MIVFDCVEHFTVFFSTCPVLLSAFVPFFPEDPPALPASPLTQQQGRAPYTPTTDTHAQIIFFHICQLNYLKNYMQIESWIELK